MTRVTLTLKPLVYALAVAGLVTVQRPLPWVVAPWEIGR